MVMLLAIMSAGYSFIIISDGTQDINSFIVFVLPNIAQQRLSNSF